jgi:hypothetical protein
MKLRNTLAYGFLVVAILLVLAITFTIGWRPIVGPKTRALTDRRFESAPARLARGDYLVNAVASCFGCHSEVDWKNEVIPSATRGAGEVLTVTRLSMSADNRGLVWSSPVERHSKIPSAAS